MVRVCESNIIFLCIRLPVHPSSVHYAILLYHWAEFNQICYITSPSWKGCARTTIFFRACACPNVAVLEQHYFSVYMCVRRPSICPSCYLLQNHWAEFNHTCYMTSPHGKGVQEQVRPSISRAISSFSSYHGDLRWCVIDCAF